MDAQNVWARSVDPEGKWLYRVGGIAAIVLVVGYFLTFPIYFWVGDQPASGVEAQLAYFAEHAPGWWAIVFRMVFTDLLLVPIFFGIYMALKHVNKGLQQSHRLRCPRRRPNRDPLHGQVLPGTLGRPSPYQRHAGDGLLLACGRSALQAQ